MKKSMLYTLRDYYFSLCVKYLFYWYWILKYTTIHTYIPHASNNETIRFPSSSLCLWCPPQAQDDNEKWWQTLSPTPPAKHVCTLVCPLISEDIRCHVKNCRGDISDMKEEKSSSSDVLGANVFFRDWQRLIRWPEMPPGETDANKTGSRFDHWYNGLIQLFMRR